MYSSKIDSLDKSETMNIVDFQVLQINHVKKGEGLRYFSLCGHEILVNWSHN
jgi:hypothetical protein